MRYVQRYLKAKKHSPFPYHPGLLLSLLPSALTPHSSALWIMPCHFNPAGPPPPYPSQDSQTGILISISERELEATTVSSSTVAPRMRLQRRSAQMTTGGSSTRLSSTSISPRASSQTPSSSGRRSPPLLRGAAACLHPRSPTVLTGVSHSQSSTAMRHQSPNLGSLRPTPQPPRLGLRMTMWPQTAGNPYN